MKKIFRIDTILLLAVILVFVTKISYLSMSSSVLYFFILCVYIYINIILRKTSMIGLKYKGNYWTYMGLPFILLGKTFFISVILANIEGPSKYNSIMNVILIAQAILPSFNLAITSYITSDNNLLYQGRKTYSFNEFKNYVIVRKTLGVNIISGYLKNKKVLYIVLSDEGIKKFKELYEISERAFNWKDFIGKNKF